MAHNESEDLQLYLSRVRPLYNRLFSMAHAITGNSETAEYSLQYALMEHWANGFPSRHGFREGLRNSLIHSAMRSAQSDADFDWNALNGSEEESDPIRQLLSQEGLELRRVLVLKYGCGLSLRRIGRIMSLEPKRIQTALSRFEARAKRKLPAELRKRCDGLIHRSISAELNRPSPLAPDIGRVFRTFQADAAALSRPSRLPARILHGIIALLLALICIIGFWLAAVLMQPPVLESPDMPTHAAESMQESNPF